jgi:hypothetical protein
MIAYNNCGKDLKEYIMWPKDDGTVSQFRDEKCEQEYFRKQNLQKEIELLPEQRIM